ncbi:MAG: NYN domain-containing protein [Ignavibacteriaceae bacterium]
MNERTIVYVDGFNLYFGLRTKGWKRYCWLNLQPLSQNILKSNQTLVCTKYFTSRVSNPPSKVKRQTTYIEALETLSNFYIYYGHYQHNIKTCSKCGDITAVPNEKMTDVNIAVEMLTAVFEDKYDVAILISADSDLVGMIKSIKRLFSCKKIIVAFLPARFSVAIHDQVHSSFNLGRKKLADSIFPDNIMKADGFILTKP